jgi:prophage regulatory protein
MLPDTILRLPAVKAATGLSRSTIYDRIQKGSFPAPVSLGGNAVGWPASEIGAWIERTIAEGRGSINKPSSS